LDKTRPAVARARTRACAGAGRGRAWFMGGVGDPDRCQLAGTVKLGQHHRVAAIGLHPVTCLDWDQRRSHHNAFMPTAG